MVCCPIRRSIRTPARRRDTAWIASIALSPWTSHASATHSIAVSSSSDDDSSTVSAPAPPSSIAVVHSRLELIRPLIAAGAEVNGIVESTAMTPLHTAAMCGNEQAVKLLLELGADPALRTTRGQSAAELAAGPHRDDITSLLKKHTSN